MLDPIITYLQNLLSYKSDAPVLLVLVGVILYGFSFLIQRFWFALSVTIALIVSLYFPFFYIAPSFTKTLASLNVVGTQWIVDEDISRSIGLGLMVGFLFSCLVFYLISSTIVEAVRRTNPLYLLSLRKEPSNKDYQRVPSNLVSEYLNSADTMLAEKLVITDINYTRNNLDDEGLIKMAMAWVCLGVPVHRAVKKVQLDIKLQIA